MPREPDLPDLYATLDYRSWLQDWFDARKAANPRYSHRLFARRAGVRSPSLLREVIDGKRNLTANTLEGFVQALDLSSADARFFGDLVALDQADTEEERNEAWERVAASKRFREAHPIAGASVAYLSHWYIVAIRELALRDDFRRDARWVARQLRPRITAAQARSALETLESLGLLVEADGRWRPADVSLATPHEVAGLAAHNYHREMLDRVREAIQGAEPEERHLAGVTVCIPMALVPRLKAEFDAFQERLLHLCVARADEAERVYQLELALVPLSEEPSR